MAAGKGRRLKLEIDTHTKLNVDHESNHNIKNPSMASAPGQTLSSPMDNTPDHMSPFDQTATSSLQSQPPMSRASASLAAARRRRPSKGSMSSSLKRSVSTPNVRGVLTAESSMSLADKRRNKLGYHRTSVACGKLIILPPRLWLISVQVIVDGARYDVCSLSMTLRVGARIVSD
ncbi:MAG: hypothetical protein Q9226_004100 [Calogaya cf. arnoldii]